MQDLVRKWCKHMQFKLLVNKYNVKISKSVQSLSNENDIKL